MSKIKNPKRETRSVSKKAAPGRYSGAVAASTYKPEPAYININEHQAEIAAKSRVLWLLVAVFTAILAIFWLAVLKINIQKETSGIGLSQIGNQISASLARFDTEIKNRTAPKAISADDLAAIKTNLEEQIKSNPDSSLWPTHELTPLNISIQYPIEWDKSAIGKAIVISDGKYVASSTDKGSGLITISQKSNAQKNDLATWLQKNNIINAGYSIERPLFISSSSTVENLIFNSSSTDVNRLDKIIYLNSTSSKSVWEIKITASGDIKYYEPLTEEIIRTIKIIK